MLEEVAGLEKVRIMGHFVTSRNLKPFITFFNILKLLLT